MLNLNFLKPKETKQPKIIIFTGAGISAESGLSTFRGQGGLWNEYDIDKVCNYSRFFQNRKNPIIREEIFSFYQLMFDAVQSAKPNQSHILCAELQKKYGSDRVHIVTTNVDNLHTIAGAHNVTHVHGKIDELSCLSCNYVWQVEKIDHNEKCPKCSSSVTKPNVIFFGESAPKYSKLLSLTHPKRIHPKDIILVIGSSLQVVGIDFLIRNDIYSLVRTNNIIINKDPTEFDYKFNHVLIGNATEKTKDAVAIIEKNFY